MELRRLKLLFFSIDKPESKSQVQVQVQSHPSQLNPKWGSLFLDCHQLLSMKKLKESISIILYFAASTTRVIQTGQCKFHWDKYLLALSSHHGSGKWTFCLVLENGYFVKNTFKSISRWVSTPSKHSGVRKMTLHSSDLRDSHEYIQKQVWWVDSDCFTDFGVTYLRKEYPISSLWLM